MKKAFLLVAVLITTVTFSQRIEKGGKQLNAGLLLNQGGGIFPVYAGLDYGITNDISVGGEISFASSNNSSVFRLIGNGNYHFNSLLEIPNEWDFYAGLSLHFGFTTFNGSSHNYGPYFGGQIGGRYYFTDNLGINLEFGGRTNAGNGKIGISYKF